MLAVGMLSLAFLDKLICTVNIFLLRIPIELFMKGRVVEKTKGQNSQDPLRRGRRAHHIPSGLGHHYPEDARGLGGVVQTGPCT